MPNSVRSDMSARSTGSRRYRTVSRGSNVDESLFGSAKGASPGGNVLGEEELARLVNTKPSKVEVDSLVITTGELDRLRKAATVNPLQEKAAALERARAQREAAQAAAKERKKAMQAREAARKAALPKSDLEQEDADNAAAIVSAAQKAKDEQHDTVKEMNRMQLYAKCVTIRDAQLLEKQLLAKQKEEEERQMDLAMEEERVRALSMYEERELRKEEERKAGAAIIRRQIEERERERIRQAELQDQEREAMLRQIAALKEQEEQLTEARRVAGQRLLEEASAANKQQLERKKQAKLAEELEEQRIVEYIREKEAREAERMAEEEAIARAKIEQQRKMLEAQEGAADKKAEEDELRARRAQEQYERNWRAKERAEAEKKAKQLSEIMDSRQAQMRDKELRSVSQARAEQEQFERIIAVQREQERAEEEKARKVAAAALAHGRQIQEGIAANAERRAKEKQAYLEAGNKDRYAREAELKRLQTIKERKVEELRKAGVPGKYLSELEKKKIG